MVEWCGPLLWSQAQSSTKCRQGKRPIVLCTSSHNPVTVADALEKRVRIIIRGDAFLFGIAGLWCPEVLAIGHQYSRKRLTVFFGAFAKETSRLGVCRRRSYHGVQRIQLPQMLEVVLPLCNLLFQRFPTHKAYIPLIMQQLHYHFSLCIPIKYHLKIGCHRQNLVHRLIFGIDAHQRHQAIEVRIMSEAEISSYPTSGDCRIGISLDTVPERNSTTGCNASVHDLVAIMKCHPTVVQLIHSLHLFFSEEVVERYLYFHILHIRGDGMKFCQQLLPVQLRQVAGICKQRVDESVC